MIRQELHLGHQDFISMTPARWSLLHMISHMVQKPFLDLDMSNWRCFKRQWKGLMNHTGPVSSLLSSFNLPWWIVYSLLTVHQQSSLQTAIFCSPVNCEAAHPSSPIINIKVTKACKEARQAPLMPDQLLTAQAETYSRWGFIVFLPSFQVTWTLKCRSCFFCIF